MTRNLDRALPLACALTLAGSALMAGSGVALAGKAPPTITGADIGYCNESGDDTRYRTTVHLEGKGRWGFVTVTLNLPSEPLDFPVDEPLRVRLAPEQEIVVFAPGTPVPATITVTVTSRKGDPVQGESVTTPLFCD